MKIYKYGDKLMTVADAKAVAPNPRFFDRATKQMTKAQALAILRRNIDEMQFWLNQDKALAEGRVAGRVTKHSYICAANRLHDWRTSMNILSGGLGQPYLWEVVNGEPLANAVANHAETSGSPLRQAALLALGLLWMTERQSDKVHRAYTTLRDALGGKEALREGIQAAMDAGHEADHPHGADWWAGKKEAADGVETNDGGRDA